MLNERYLLLNMLGKGGFSEVYKVRLRPHCADIQPRLRMMSALKRTECTAWCPAWVDCSEALPWVGAPLV